MPYKKTTPIVRNTWESTYEVISCGILPLVGETTGNPGSLLQADHHVLALFLLSPSILLQLESYSCRGQLLR